MQNLGIFLEILRFAQNGKVEGDSSFCESKKKQKPLQGFALRADFIFMDCHADSANLLAMTDFFALDSAIRRIYTYFRRI